MILITRATEEAEKLAEILDRQDFEYFCEPMLEIKNIQPDWENYLTSHIQSFFATSKNGRKHASPSYPLAAIPKQGRNSYELLQWMLKNLKPENGKLIYLRGDIVSFDITGELRKHGFIVEEVIVYHSIAPQNFSRSFLDNLPNITLATFFSNKSLSNFLALIEKNKLRSNLKKLRFLCISEEVAEQLDGYKTKEIYISETPDLNGMINKINEIY